MKRAVFTMALCLLFSVTAGGAQARPCKQAAQFHGQYVSIIKKNTHYEVVIDLPVGSSHLAMGTEYAEGIHAVLPDIEQVLDSYLTELISGTAAASGVDQELLWQEYLARMHDIKPQIPQEYQHEIEGMALGFQGTADVLGDGVCSVNELYILNLLPDIMRGTACSAFAAFGRRSVTGKTIAARNLDWYVGSAGQLAQIHAVTSIKQGEKSIGTIGFLGMMGVISAINDNHIFAAILDSQTGAPYSSAGKRSYLMDLRYALETYATLDAIAAALIDPVHDYAFNHNIFLADPRVARVVENNVSDATGGSHRAVRSWNSSLNSGIEWGVSNAVAVVNSFVLEGSTDNHTQYPDNYQRWNFLRAKALGLGQKIDNREIQTLIGYHEQALTEEPAEPDIFSRYTLQSMIVRPSRFWLQLAFIPTTGIWAESPRYETVHFDFR